MKKRSLIFFALIFLPIPLLANNIMPVFLFMGIPIFIVGHIIIVVIESFYYKLVFKPVKKRELLKIVIILNIVTTIVGSLIIFILNLFIASVHPFFKYISGYVWEGMNFSYHLLGVGFDFIWMYFTTTFIECVLFLSTNFGKTHKIEKVIKTVVLANLLSYVFLAILYYTPFLIAYIID